MSKWNWVFIFSTAIAFGILTNFYWALVVFAMCWIWCEVFL